MAVLQCSSAAVQLSNELGGERVDRAGVQQPGRLLNGPYLQASITLDQTRKGWRQRRAISELFNKPMKC